MGADCAGAVQVLPRDHTPGTESSRARVDSADIAGKLRELRKDDAAWASSGARGRWSLGGQQGKIALGRDQHGWYEPGGREPSTHILKVGVVGLDDSDLAEYVTMKAARTLGLDVAQAAVMSFEDQHALVVTRYDRFHREDGSVVRLHQEDMCQSLGLWRASKYQSDGGPSAADIATLLQTSADPRDRPASLASFAQANVFSWVAACPDAHAKNYSLLHLAGRTRLAPLYDLISGAFVTSVDEVKYEVSLAMKMGGKYKLRDIAARHVEKAAGELRVDPEWLLDEAVGYSAGLPDAVEDALTDLDGLIDKDVARSFVDGIADRTGHLRGYVLSDYTRARPQPEPEVAGPVWVDEHMRGGRKVAGHWRGRRSQ